MTGDELRSFMTERVRPAVLESYRADSCVATTQIAVEVLHYMGVKAKPWPCALLVANNAGARVLVDGPDLTPAEVQDLIDAGAHCVEVRGSGAVGPNGEWDGHLVVVAGMDDGTWLLDLSLDQTRRGAWQMHPKPCAVRTRELWPTEPVVARVEDVLVRWSPIDSTGWRQHGDWNRPGVNRPIAGRLIRDLRDLVSAR